MAGAVVCVLCFQFYPYRMVDLFERGAFPEFAAFTWLPLLALYAVQAVAAHRPANSAPGAMQEDTELSPGAYRLPLVKAGLTFAALILTHSLTALMAVMVAAILLVLLAAFQTRERSAALRLQVKCAVMVVAIGTFLSAWFSLPVLLELNWVIIGHGFELSRWVDNFAGWPDLFEFNPFYSYDSLREPTLFLPIYVIPIVIAAPFVVVSAKNTRTSALHACHIFGDSHRLLVDYMRKFLALDQFRILIRKVAVPLALAALCGIWHGIALGGMPRVSYEI